MFAERMRGAEDLNENSHPSPQMGSPEDRKLDRTNDIATVMRNIMIWKRVVCRAFVSDICLNSHYDLRVVVKNLISLTIDEQGGQGKSCRYARLSWLY